jgi:glucose/arabinose dehydrogenase
MHVKNIIKLLIIVLLITACSTSSEVSKTTQKINETPNKDFKPVAETLVKNLEKPTDLFYIDKNTFLVAQTKGDILLYKNNKLVETFLDISSEVKVESELGLLSILLVPSSSSNSTLFIYYGTAKPDTFTALDSFQVKNNKVDLESRQNIFKLPQPYKNHNGGELQLDENGDLYLSTGDGGDGGDPENRAQNLNNYWGKILKFNIANKDYLALKKLDPQILAYGLRNPWRYTIDYKSNKLIISDVGQNELEEVNVIDFDPEIKINQKEIYNFGWRCFEGKNEFSPQDCTADQELVEPVFTFSHDEGCSITGGDVYRGNIKDLDSKYLFTDFCNGDLYSLDLTNNKVNKFFETESAISNLSTGLNQDQILFFDYGKGQLVAIKQAP